MRRSRATFAFLTVAAILVGFGQPHAAKAEALSGPGAIESVTVYRGQAMVTRTLSLAELEGRAEVVFTELPVHVVSDSVAAEAGPGVEVGFTRYRTRPVAEDVREEVRELDQQIEAVQHELQNVEAELTLVTHARQYLTNLEGFTANTAKTELANGVLNAETLTSLSDYLLKKRADLAERELVAQRERQELGERQNLLQRERHRLTSASSRTAREAVISLNVVEPGPDAAVRLRYLVTHATWSPSYAVRAGGDGGPVRIEYHASIEQTSGEDWNDVAMTLSTATPTLTAEAPELASLVLQLTRGADASQLAKNFGYDNLEEAQREIRGQQQQVAKQRDIQGGKASPAQANGALFGDRDPMPRETNDQRLNTLAANAQALEMLAERPTDADRLAATTRSLSRPTDDSLSVAYALDGRTSLPSRSDRQLARIRSLELPAETYLTAVPVLTNKVYREASLTNTSGLVLLSGPVASYLDGRFVGHSQMPSVFEGERFEVGLGVDATLRASREVLDRQEKVQGGNRLLTLTYALRLMNFSDEPADVRLMGRLPVSDNDQAVKITLADSGQPLSDAAGYTQALRDDGILRWDVNVPAHATGDEAFELTYRVTIEHDKQLTFGDVSTR